MLDLDFHRGFRAGDVVLVDQAGLTLFEGGQEGLDVLVGLGLAPKFGDYGILDDRLLARQDIEIVNVFIALIDIGHISVNEIDVRHREAVIDVHGAGGLDLVEAELDELLGEVAGRDGHQGQRRDDSKEKSFHYH